MAVINGNNLANTLNGGTAADSIFGFEGNDLINAGGGNDTVDAGIDNDTVFGGTGKDYILLGDGNDQADGGSDNDTIYGGVGADSIYGGSQADMLYGEDGNDTLDGGSHNDGIWGGEGNDVIIGDSGSDTIDAGIGDDNIDAGSDNDTVLAGAGNDTVVSGSGNDNVQAGSGDDILSGDSGNDVMLGEGGNDSLTGGSGNDNLNGDGGTATNATGNLLINGSFEDPGVGATVQSYGFSNTSIPGWVLAEGTQFEIVDSGHRGILSTDGTHWLDMDATADNLDISQMVAGLTNGANYHLHFDAADYPGDNAMQVYWNGQLLTTVNTDSTTMQGFDFTVVGGAGDSTDTLRFVGTGPEDNVGVELDNVSLVSEDTSNFAGNDTLNGGTGIDTLTGGAGDDFFQFKAADSGVGAGSRDIITDFVHGEDVIDLTAYVPPLAFIGGAAFTAGGGGEVRFEFDGVNTIVTIDGNDDGVGEMQIQLNGNVALDGGDFVL